MIRVPNLSRTRSSAEWLEFEDDDEIVQLIALLSEAVKDKKKLAKVKPPRKTRTFVSSEKLAKIAEIVDRLSAAIKPEELSLLVDLAVSTLTHNKKIKKIIDFDIQSNKDGVEKKFRQK